MANKRPKAPAFTSPKGIFKYPRVSEPDFGTKEYPNPAGSYKLDLVLKADDPVTQAFIAKLQPLYEQAMQNADKAFKALKAETRKKLKEVTQNALYTELLDPDTEEPTGEISFRFSMKASGQYGDKSPKKGQYWDAKPSIFGPRAEVLSQGIAFRDRADGEEFADVHPTVKPSIWGGTVGKVSFEVGIDKDGEPGYFIPGTGAAGLSLKLTAVQVIELVSGGTKSAKDFGFGDETEGEDGDAEEQPATEDTGADF